MRIDGKAIADAILGRVTADVMKLKARGITPTLAVILIGDDPASLAYIRQKQNVATRIGADLLFTRLPESAGADELETLVERSNADPHIHGLIIQRPIPAGVGDVSRILASVSPQKDIDGFLPNSPYDVPVALAVGEILKTAYSSVIPTAEPESNKITSRIPDDIFFEWLKTKRIAIIGRGETAGGPIAAYFRKHECATSIIHSRTPDPTRILHMADIVISCVGKERVVTSQTIKPGAILMSVGIWRDTTGKLRGDYDEEDIKSTASRYTPTPGGVGPVNVACLMQNLARAAS